MLWRSTLRELHERSVAFRWHDRRNLEYAAIHARWLLSAWVENPPTVAQLLGDSDPPDNEATLDRLTGATTPEEQRLRNLDRAYEKQIARKATP